MRAVILAFACGVVLAATSVQAAPVPRKATPVERHLGRRTGCRRLRMGLAPSPLARPMGLLGLGSLRCERVVTSTYTPRRGVKLSISRVLRNARSRSACSSRRCGCCSLT
jgi:hypothetical protein